MQIHRLLSLIALFLFTNFGFINSTLARAVGTCTIKAGANNGSCYSGKLPIQNKGNVSIDVKATCGLPQHWSLKINGVSYTGVGSKYYSYYGPVGKIAELRIYTTGKCQKTTTSYIWSDD